MKIKQIKYMAVFNLVLNLLIQPTLFSSEDLTIVAVGDAALERERIYFEEQSPSKLSPSQKMISREFISIFRSDFSFYKKHFEILSANSIKKISTVIPEFDYLAGKRINYFCLIKVFKKGKTLGHSVVMIDVSKRKVVLKENGSLSFRQVRTVAHKLTNKIYKKITGVDSIFTTNITFVSDAGRIGPKAWKELYIMDFDGKNRKRLTFHNGTVISPAISEDKKKILYSLIRDNMRWKKKRNVDLYLYDVGKKRSRLVSSKRGLNSGAIFLPGTNSKIALTLSYRGNSEIYIMDIISRKLKRITKHFAVDVDPSISANGKLMTFLSGRSGSAMVYILDPSATEKNVKRISYVGKYNATPRFSPNGKEIVFSSWMDNCFDIFRINSNGTGLSRLTRNFGSNEDPSYSKDGQFIIFSSQRVLSVRRAVQNIYIMDKDGEIVGPVTKNFGNCITPRWSN